MREYISQVIEKQTQLNNARTELKPCRDAYDDVKQLLAAERAKVRGLRDALDEINKRDTYNAESYGIYAQIARRALAATEPKGD